MRFLLSAVLAFACTFGADASGRGVLKSEYLDLMEAAVSAYSDDHIKRYIAEVEREGVQEHGFPRLAANIGILVANGRIPAKRDAFRRMMSICCREAARGPMKIEGNEFSVKELVLALDAAERAGIFDKADTDSWRADLSRVEAKRCYRCVPNVGASRAYNWCVFGCASEQARIALGMGGDAAHVEKYVADQLRWFDANGMYRDPNQPAVYDLVTRLQFMAILDLGYDGQSRARLEELLDRAAEPTLAMLSASGEIPYGGRSNQFLHNHTFYAAVCEWYAARYRACGDDSKAARFRRAAREAVDSLKTWLAVRPVRHVKNFYPRGEGKRGTGIGCEDYAYFDKYMVTMGSWAMLAWRFADESVDVATDKPPPSSFTTTPDFHFVFLRAGDYSAQFDYNADAHYDCDGLGRVQRRGAPSAICLSTPCAKKPNYLTERPNDGTLAIVPVGGEVLVPAGCGHDADSAWADWRSGDLDWKCRLTAEGLSMSLAGPGAVAMQLPAFVFDGENDAEISCIGKSLVVHYRGWICSYLTDGTLVDTGRTCSNRNGRYRVFEARGEKSMSVTISIRKEHAVVARGETRPPAENPKWPFIVIRHTRAINSHPKVFEQLIDCHRRHRGACDEFWFATGGRGTPEAVATACADFARFRPLCEEVGVALSYQQGLTLGHGEAHDGKPKPGCQWFDDNAWQRGVDGKVIRFLCPRAPAVVEYEREYAKAVLRTANPASYWLDDDLRLGVCKPQGCFCGRCIAAFNAKTGGKWTRESLAARLFSKNGREPVRAAWIDFNAESLAVYAAAVRQAADELKSPCRLAYQSVWADTVYTASSYLPLLKALSGKDHRPVGIRPGAGFYTEAEPRGMVKKCLSVAREAERCRDYGDLVASVCYEQDTYPRHILHKSQGAIMTECALALASGCDSLSLYWYSQSAPEPIEEYERFARTLAEARPYFERLAASTRRTRLGGVARFLGSAALEGLGFDLRDAKDFDLAFAGVPVTVAEARPKVWYLTAKSHAALTEADKVFLTKGGVVKVDDIEKYPLASRRTKLLDDLDAATGGNFPVRIDACRPLRILPRVREDGTLDSVTILNLSIGDTDELKVRVRNPVSERAILQSVKRKPSPVAVERGASANERVVTIPNLTGWQIVTVFF